MANFFATLARIAKLVFAIVNRRNDFETRWSYNTSHDLCFCSDLFRNKEVLPVYCHARALLYSRLNTQKVGQFKNCNWWIWQKHNTHVTMKDNIFYIKRLTNIDNERFSYYSNELPNHFFYY